MLKMAKSQLMTHKINNFDTKVNFKRPRPLLIPSVISFLQNVSLCLTQRAFGVFGRCKSDQLSTLFQKNTIRYRESILKLCSWKTT